MGPSGVGSGKSAHPVVAHALGELEGRLLLLRGPLGAHEPRWLQVFARAEGLLERRGVRVEPRAVHDPVDGELARRVWGPGTLLTPLARMHWENFTACSRLVAVLLVPLLLGAGRRQVPSIRTR